MRRTSYISLLEPYSPQFSSAKIELKEFTCQVWVQQTFDSTCSIQKPLVYDKST